MSDDTSATIELCEACRIAPVECEFFDGPVRRPYRLCGICDGRLHAYALRPLEWFHLAAIHGPAKFLLHDDFYDENGTAWQPEIDVEEVARLPGPTLQEVADDLPRLIDYCMTRWSLDEDALTAVRCFSPSDILEELQRRAEPDAEDFVLAVCYQLCGWTVGTIAATWVREQALKRPNLLRSWCLAAAGCLPAEETFERVVAALKQVPLQRLADEAAALGELRTERTLEWIEDTLSGTNLPLVEQWGRLAALSCLTWPRIRKWLTIGRPLSLVALDALNACWNYNTLQLRRAQPKLREPVSREVAEVALHAYATQDPAPRVKITIAQNLEHWDEIVK